MSSIKRKKREKIIKPPQLTKDEQLELQNIMLRMALEKERIDNLNMKIELTCKEMNKQEQRLSAWQTRFNNKLVKAGTSIEQVDIDAESGRVSILNVKELKALGG